MVFFKHYIAQRIQIRYNRPRTISRLAYCNIAFPSFLNQALAV